MIRSLGRSFGFLTTVALFAFAACSAPSASAQILVPVQASSSTSAVSTQASVTAEVPLAPVPLVSEVFDNASAGAFWGFVEDELTIIWISDGEPQVMVHGVLITNHVVNYNAETDTYQIDGMLGDMGIHASVYVMKTGVNRGKLTIETSDPQGYDGMRICVEDEMMPMRADHCRCFGIGTAGVCTNQNCTDGDVCGQRHCSWRATQQNNQKQEVGGFDPR